MASKVALAEIKERACERQVSNTCAIKRNCGVLKGEQRRPSTKSICRALQYSFMFLLITTTTPRLRWSWAEQGEHFKVNTKCRRPTEVAEGGSAAPGRCVAVVNTGHHEQLLGHRCGHDAGTTGRRDETHQDGTAASGNLAGHGMGFTDLVTPVSSPDRDDGQLGQDDGTTDGCGHLFGAFHTQTDVAVVVTNGDESLWTATAMMLQFNVWWQQCNSSFGEATVCAGSPWTWYADQLWSVSGQAWSWAPHPSARTPGRSRWSQPPAFTNEQVLHQYEEGHKKRCDYWPSQLLPWWAESTDRSPPGTWSSCPSPGAPA